VFAALDPEQLEKGLRGMGFVYREADCRQGWAIDGKASSGTRDRARRPTFPMVRRWRRATGWCWRKVDDKSNEITAIPEPLDALELSCECRRYRAWYASRPNGIRRQRARRLGVGCGEDRSRKRTRYTAQNFSLLNPIALKLLAPGP
jgi:hypothetical protein